MIRTVYQVWDDAEGCNVASFPVVGEPEGRHSQAMQAALALGHALNAKIAIPRFGFPRFHVNRGLLVGGRVV